MQHLRAIDGASSGSSALGQALVSTSPQHPDYRHRMATPPAQALQRVCPHCATIAVTAARQCPWCRRSYTRRLLPYLALFALLQTVITVGAVALLLSAFGNSLQSELDKQVRVVQDDFGTQLDGLDGKVRRELRRELDQRLPAQPVAPTVP